MNTCPSCGIVLKDIKNRNILCPKCSPSFPEELNEAECPDCNGTGFTSDGGNVFPCWCELGCKISDQINTATSLMSNEKS